MEPPIPPSKIFLKPLIASSLEQQKRVRDLRNQVSVRSSMYTDHEIGLPEHLAWIERLRSDQRQIVFVVLNSNGAPLGVVSVNAIDTLHKKADWAFYLDEKERGGLGAALEFTLIEYVFNELKLEKLNCEVIETNEAVVRLHKKFNFTVEGFRRDNIEKNGKRIGVYFLGLTRKDWTLSKTDISQKYQPIIGKFDIQFDYENLQPNASTFAA